MTLDEIWKFTNLLANKEQAGNVFPPDKLNQALPFANVEFFNLIYGLVQKYQPGMPIPNIAFEVTQQITDWLSELKVNMGGPDTSDPAALTVNPKGVAILPTNYYHYSALNSFYTKGDCNDFETPDIDVLTDQQWSSRVNSKLLNRKVEKRPYCNFQSGYIQFRPKDIGMVQFLYLRKPLTPFFDYYIQSNKNIVYMPPGTSHTLTSGEVYRDGTTTGTVTSISQELEYPESTHAEFPYMLLGYLGINLRDPFVKQSAEMRKQTGQ